MEKKLETIIAAIHERGNDVEIRKCKEGIKIFEIQKKLISVLEVKHDDSCH